jgi:hypothetical protein
LPTWSKTASFIRDYRDLSAADKKKFRKAVAEFVLDLKRGKGFRKGLRVKGVEGAEGVFEMTWADDGRGTFQYGREIRAKEPHVIWRRCGDHSIFKNP